MRAVPTPRSPTDPATGTDESDSYSQQPPAWQPRTSFRHALPAAVAIPRTLGMPPRLLLNEHELRAPVTVARCPCQPPTSSGHAFVSIATAVAALACVKLLQLQRGLDGWEARARARDAQLEEVLVHARAEAAALGRLVRELEGIATAAAAAAAARTSVCVGPDDGVVTAALAAPASPPPAASGRRADDAFAEASVASALGRAGRSPTKSLRSLLGGGL